MATSVTSVHDTGEVARSKVSYYCQGTETEEPGERETPMAEIENEEIGRSADHMGHAARDYIWALRRYGPAAGLTKGYRRAWLGALEEFRRGARALREDAEARVLAAEEAARSREDAADTAQADAAMSEPGDSVPWGDVKLELGL
jgi:hypothetical protein